MADHVIDRIKKKLAPGYTLVQVQPGAGRGVFEVRDSSGAPLYDEGGAPIRFGDHDSNGPAVEASLRRLGAIPPPKPRTFKPQAAAPRKAKRDPKNALEIAREILKDPKASVREKTMAKGYLRLLDNHVGVRQLAKKLGEALAEHQENVELEEDEEDEGGAFLT